MRLPLHSEHWIPPLPLAGALVFQVTAACALIAYGLAPSPGIAFAWIHAVALGWLTIVALAVLLHVIPAFTDLAWRGESIARGAVSLALLGAATLVAAFAAGAPRALLVAAALLVIAIGGYVVVAVRTLAQPAEDRTSAAIAQALAITLVVLVVTVLLGGFLAQAYARGDARVLGLAPSHALLGIGAWLSVLVTGVSNRTFRPMLGARSRSNVIHIVAGTALVAGSVIGAIGAPLSLALARLGVAIAVLGALAYAIDAFDILSRATTPHPPVRAFVGAAVLWLLVAAAALAATAWGSPLGAVAVVAALAGWIGQMVNAHFHHIGVRVVITLLRGDEDETRPWEVLDARLSWTAFAFAQLMVLATLAGLASAIGTAFVVAGLCGLATIAAIAANVATVRRRAATMPIVL